MTAKILAFAGSSRVDSLNKKFIAIAAKACVEHGAEVTMIDLKDYQMPLYDGDYESANGIPDSAKKIKQLFMTHDALLISSPEYNSSFSALLKNTIDWVSRKEAGEQPLQCFQGKVAALISASPGALGGLRGLFQLRQLLSNLNVLVIPQQVTISGADKVLVDGTINDPKKLDAISDLAKKLVKITSALKA